MFFWFSQKQKETKLTIIVCNEQRYRLFAKLNNGDIVEYTVASSTMDHGAKWNDLQFLGEGEYDHSE